MLVPTARSLVMTESRNNTSTGNPFSPLLTLIERNLLILDRLNFTFQQIKGEAKKLPFIAGERFFSSIVSLVTFQLVF